MKKGLIKLQDGTINIVHPTPEALAKGRTLEELVERLLQPGDTYEIIDESDIPQDRYFRDAWKIKYKKIEVDPGRASNIKMNHIRVARNKELAEQDVKFAKVQEKVETKRIQIESTEDQIKALQNELLNADTDVLRKGEIEAEISVLNVNKVTDKRELKKQKEDLLKIVELKQKLRDIPQTTKLETMSLENIKKYIPAELAHRDDVD